MLKLVFFIHLIIFVHNFIHLVSFQVRDLFCCYLFKINRRTSISSILNPEYCPPLDFSYGKKKSILYIMDNPTFNEVNGNFAVDFSGSRIKAIYSSEAVNS